MALAVWSRKTQPSRRWAEQVREVRETGEEALASLGKYLGMRRARPARTGGEGALAFIAGLVLGVLVAGIVALLLAPSDGATLRRRMLRKLDELFGVDLSSLASGQAMADEAGREDQNPAQPAVPSEASSEAPSSPSSAAASAAG